MCVCAHVRLCAFCFSCVHLYRNICGIVILCAEVSLHNRTGWREGRGWGGAVGCAGQTAHGRDSGWPRVVVAGRVNASCLLSG